MTRYLVEYRETVVRFIEIDADSDECLVEEVSDGGGVELEERRQTSFEIIVLDSY